MLVITRIKLRRLYVGIFCFFRSWEDLGPLFCLTFFSSYVSYTRVKFMRKTENTKNADEIYEDFQIKNEIVNLQKFYVNGKLENLEELVQKRKEKLIEDICEYKNLYEEDILDKDGFPTGKTKLIVHPHTVSHYFFRSINNLHNIEPQYSGEHLSVLWDLYSEMVDEVNINLAEFTPNLSHFCRFIGISSNGFKKLKNSADEGIRIVAEKIYDYFYDGAVTMAQLGKHNSRAMVFRMKSELERVEKEVPQVIVNTTTVDLDEFNKRINELQNFDNRIKASKTVKEANIVDYGEK